MSFHDFLVVIAFTTAAMMVMNLCLLCGISRLILHLCFGVAGGLNNYQYYFGGSL